MVVVVVVIMMIMMMGEEMGREGKSKQKLYVQTPDQPPLAASSLRECAAEQLPSSWLRARVAKGLATRRYVSSGAQGRPKSPKGAEFQIDSFPCLSLFKIAS